MIGNMLCLIGGAKQNHIQCMVFGLFILWMICEGGFRIFSGSYFGFYRTV